MQRSEQLPFSGGDRLGWARFGNLILPPEIAVLLDGSAPPSFDGHVPSASVPDVPSNARDFSPAATSGAEIASSVGNGVPALCCSGRDNNNFMNERLLSFADRLFCGQLQL